MFREIVSNCARFVPCVDASSEKWRRGAANRADSIRREIESFRLQRKYNGRNVAPEYSPAIDRSSNHKKKKKKNRVVFQHPRTSDLDFSNSLV